MPHFRPFLSFGLSNHEEHQVCAVAVGVVGDICRALEGKVQPYCQEILQLLLADLQNPTLNRNVKPPILSCFGDIALAVGGDFEPYLPVTMSMLQQAGQTSMDVSNSDLAEYLCRLREGIFEAYTGVLQGLRADNKGAAFQPYLPAAMHLLAQVRAAVPGCAVPEVTLAGGGIGWVCGQWRPPRAHAKRRRTARGTRLSCTAHCCLHLGGSGTRDARRAWPDGKLVPPVASAHARGRACDHDAGTKPPLPPLLYRGCRSPGRRAAPLLYSG
jgi:hypothetical protein